MIQPFISICVPVYNGETYLRECLDSCFSQDYTNFEVVLCDDGSSDGSLELIQAYQIKYPQLQLYKNDKNLGLVGNWNRCLDLAKGEWIKFVFQDDYISKNCLNEFVKRIKPDTQLLVSKRHFILPVDASAEVRKYYSSVVRTLGNTCGLKTWYSAKEISRAAIKNIGMNFIAEPSLSIFRSSALKEAGLFNPQLKQICDLEFMLRIATRYGLEFINKDLCFFRIHGSSTTSTNVSSKYFELKFIEPVIFSSILLGSSKFVNFRKHLNVFQFSKLNLYFQLKCYQAARENKRLGINHPVFDAKNSEHEAIQKAGRGNWFIVLLALVIRASGS